MPALHLAIKRAWRHSKNPDRIHYIVEGEKDRHLYADRGSGLFTVLDKALLDKGYTMPASASRRG